ncbi:hypothetical protein Aph02nite_32400 [Actinoplanes philippinensis]|nr:hypothetical protein Aph02nite_32400 [Actinoplanes philippinensis]
MRADHGGMRVGKGSKTDLSGSRFTVSVRTAETSALVDVAAVLLGPDGRVRSDDDFVFFNNPEGPGVELVSDAAVRLDLERVPGDVQRILVSGSTEAQGRTFGELSGLAVDVHGAESHYEFEPDGLTAETVLQVVALYRRGGGWRLDAIGQGYDGGLAAFATDHGIDVGDPGPDAAVEAPAPAAAPAPAPAADAGPPPSPVAAGPAVDFRKVKVSLTKDDPARTARIDLRKSQGEPGWVLTVGLEWDGRGASYDRGGAVTSYGSGDLDVYFFCRDEATNRYVVISGESRHRGSLGKWPFVKHSGDSKGPGRDNRPAVERVHVKPTENGDLLVNVYQSVDNGAGAIDKFGRPRVVIRYGRAEPDGLPGPDADEIVVHVGNGRNSFWATVAHIDVRDGILTVDGETRYSSLFSEVMPVLDTAGNWVQRHRSSPVGRSKRRNRGIGLTTYEGSCPAPGRRWFAG